MKIIHLIEAAATGTLSMALLLGNAQAEEGKEVIFVYSKRPETPHNIKDLFSDESRSIEIDMNGLCGLRSIFVIRNLIKRELPDVVVLHSSYAGFIGRLSNLGIKGVSLYYIPHCISFMRKDIGIIKKNIFVLLEKIASIKSSVYLACSESERREINNKIPMQDCFLVENAVPVTVNRKENMRVNGDLTIVTVGQIRTQKGPTDFAEICSITKALIPDVRFIWVGDGDETLKEKLLDSGVHVTGWIAREDVSTYLVESDIYLSTSYWEGMPVSIIEANYAELLVIASSCSGNVDVVEHGVNGYLFKDKYEAKELIVRMWQNENLREILSKKGRVDALQKYTSDRYVSQMNEIMGC